MVLVYAKKLTEELLDSIAEPLPLTNLRLLPPAALRRPPRRCRCSRHGECPRTLGLATSSAGQRVPRAVIPSLAIAIFVIAAFTYAVLRHARETTNAIEASEARFRDVADASSDWIWEVDARCA